MPEPKVARRPSPRAGGLDSAWQGAEAIGSDINQYGVRSPDMPLDPQDELFARIKTLPDLLEAIGLPMPIDLGAATAGGEGMTQTALAKLIGTRTFAGSRIAKGGQNALDQFSKIPRFRSPLGTFIKHEGKWWRLQPFPADASAVTLEWLGESAKATAGKVPQVLESKSIPVQDLVNGIRLQKGADLVDKVRRR